MRRWNNYKSRLRSVSRNIINAWKNSRSLESEKISYDMKKSTSGLKTSKETFSVRNCSEKGRSFKLFRNTWQLTKKCKE